MLVRVECSETCGNPLNSLHRAILHNNLNKKGKCTKWNWWSTCLFRGDHDLSIGAISKDALDNSPLYKKSHKSENQMSKLVLELFQVWLVVAIVRVASWEPGGNTLTLTFYSSDNLKKNWKTKTQVKRQIGNEDFSFNITCTHKCLFWIFMLSICNCLIYHWCW